MQDLLQDFESPCVMDCKMGTRYVALCYINIFLYDIYKVILPVMLMKRSHPHLLDVVFVSEHT